MESTGMSDSPEFTGGLATEPSPDDLGPDTGAPSSPEAPDAPPADAGQGEGGQGEGQGEGGSPEPEGHQLNPEVTRLQQELAEERRRAAAREEFLRQELEASRSALAQPAAASEPVLDPDAQRQFDAALAASSVGRKLQASAAGAVALATDVSLRGRDHYDAPGVREAILRDVSRAGVSDPAQLAEVAEMAYDHHTRSLRTNEVAALKARIAELEKRDRVASGGPTGASTRAPDVPAPGVEETSEQYRNRMGLPPRTAYDV